MRLVDDVASWAYSCPFCEVEVIDAGPLSTPLPIFEAHLDHHYRTRTAHLTKGIAA